MKITDGKRTVEINIMTWNGIGVWSGLGGRVFQRGRASVR